MAIKQIDYYDKSFTINYEVVNSDKTEVIVFLHGWGSNKEIMKQAFGDKLKGFKHIYIDMPGFGKSDNNFILTTIDYANIVKIFLNKLTINSNDITILGHSFGGKVATYLMPKLLILLSTAGIVEEKSAKTLLTIRMAKIFNRFGLGKITKMFRSNDVNGMPQNMYETFKNVVDEDFSIYFKGFNKKALIFWGEKDIATSLESGKIIHSFIKNSSFKSYDGDHFFFLKQSDDICTIIKNKISQGD